MVDLSLCGQASLTTIRSPWRSSKATWPLQNTEIIFFWHHRVLPARSPSRELHSYEWKATSHRARVVTAYTAYKHLITEDWPASSPDLKLIEHAWDMLTDVNSLTELSVAVKEEWNDFDQNKLRRLVRSVPQRCREMIQARGGATPTTDTKDTTGVMGFASMWKTNGYSLSSRRCVELHQAFCDFRQQQQICELNSCNLVTHISVVN